MKSRRLKGFCSYTWLPAVLGVLCAAAPARLQAAPMQWAFADGGNDHFYELISNSGFINWTDARDAAKARGGYLATITSEAENVFLTALSFFEGEHRESWIGLNDAATEGQFEWITGEAVSYVNWAPGEPNNDPRFDGEDYAILNPPPEAAGTWNDLPNNPQRVTFYLVEYDQDPSEVPEPGTWLTFAAGLAALVQFRRRRR